MIVEGDVLPRQRLSHRNLSRDLGHGKPAWFAEIVERPAAGHRAVFDAIRARDPAAARSK